MHTCLFWGRIVATRFVPSEGDEIRSRVSLPVTGSERVVQRELLLPVHNGGRTSTSSQHQRRHAARVRTTRVQVRAEHAADTKRRTTPLELWAMLTTWPSVLHRCLWIHDGGN